MATDLCKASMPIDAESRSEQPQVLSANQTNDNSMAIVKKLIIQCRGKAWMKTQASGIYRHVA